ncbi:hypothetical protein B0T10DRAFT_541641 [Thelonectria olida]|uniref:Uncharacterized protein n=1 Tax=Thelonectria olida TaxID=1576542 RepID=A0A9P9AH30_9HYPO|nr:hypothetical protein B0T10DRAFT_541641 [Thelonectria olida]
MDRGISGSPFWAQAEKQVANSGFFDSWDPTFDMNTTTHPLQNQLHSNSFGEQNAFGTPPVTRSGVPSTSIGTPGTGTPQPCTLNLVLRPEQLDNGNQGTEMQTRIDRVEYRLERMEHRLERVDHLLGDLQTCLTNLGEKIELQRTSHEEKVNYSIETIKKGMDKFFTRFARQLEKEMMDLEDHSGSQAAELAVM